MGLPRRFAAALFAAFLIYACQISSLFDERVRYNVQWGRDDAAAILLGILALAGAAVGVDALVRWSNLALLRRLLNHAFLAVVASGFLLAFSVVTAGFMRVLPLWLVAMLGIVFSFLRPRWRVDLRAAKVCSWLSPAVALAAVLMLSWKTWPAQPEPRSSLEQVAERAAAHPSAAKATPVVFILFDEWSSLRSSENGRFRSSLENLCSLAGQSVVFTEALSASEGTIQSLPRMIYQTDGIFAVANGETAFVSGDARESTQQVPSLFQLARERGYTTFLLGFYHCYRQMLGDQVDYCNVHQWRRQGGGLAETVRFRAANNGPYLVDPVLRRLGCSELTLRLWSRPWFDMGTAYRTEMLDILSIDAPATFAMFHAPWPHYPFVFNPDGSYRGPSADTASVDGYLRHLEYVDTLVGEILASLRAAGKFDDALLILTSDHGWRDDPDPQFNTLPNFKRRVPLVIKLPGQQTGCTSNREICNNQLKPLFEAVFKGERDVQTLQRLLGVNAKSALAPQK